MHFVIKMHENIGLVKGKNKILHPLYINLHDNVLVELN